jgi:hypothetical protein
VVPAIITVDSPKEVVAPGSYTDINLNAICPSGYSVLGTGFNAEGVGTVGFVLSYGTFVGGFISNQSSVTITVYVQAICGVVPSGSSGANARHASSSGAQYQRDVQAALALHR